jgi:hypothetical protein
MDQDEHAPDFRRGKRGRIAPAQPEPPGAPVRIDQDLVDYSLKEADKSGGKSAIRP